MASIPVVFCFDKRIILGASVAIKSLIDCAKPETIYDIRVFHSDLSLENQKNITKLCENSRHNIAFHYINPEIFKNAPHNNHSWTEIVYYRFLAPVLVAEYDKIIYSDVDVLFKADLSDLYNINVSDYELGAVISHKKSSKDLKSCTNENIYYSGLLLYNAAKFRNDNILAKLLKNALKHKKELNYFDLDLMNITCKKIANIPVNYCILQAWFSDKKDEFYSEAELDDAVRNPAIIHYAGNPGKPWRFKNPYPDYKKCMDSLPKELRKYTFRDFRKKLFSKV